MALLTLRFAGRIDLADDVYSGRHRRGARAGQRTERSRRPRSGARPSRGSRVARRMPRLTRARRLGLADVAKMPEAVIVAELAFALADLDRLDEAVAELDRLGPPESDLCIVNPLLDARSQILALGGPPRRGPDRGAAAGGERGPLERDEPGALPVALDRRAAGGTRRRRRTGRASRRGGARAGARVRGAGADRAGAASGGAADAQSERDGGRGRGAGAVRVAYGELVRALIDQGAMLRVAGHRREAREPLTRALGLAQETGLVACERQAREELLAAGARPRRAALTSGADALTPGERRVAELAARGQHESRDSAGAVRDRQGRAVPPDECVPEAGRQRAGRDRRGARAVLSWPLRVPRGVSVAGPAGCDCG